MSAPNELTPAPEPRPGRPRALDEIKRAKIVAAVAAGFNIERAARYVGCAPTTIHREYRRNPEFCRELDRAIFSSELAPLQAIREAARKHWRAGVWLLERLNPELFARRNPTYVTPEQLQGFTENLSNILSKEVTDPHERQRIYDKLAALVVSVETMARETANTPPRRRSRRRARELTREALELAALVEQELQRRALPPALPPK